jgi:CRISPR-associated exonuclease Cas4
MPSSEDQLVARAMVFRDLVESFDLHGLLFQHVGLCERRAWLHMNRIDYSHLEERMKLGSVSHDLHRTRDRSVEGLIGISPDRIDWDGRKVIEAKGSAGARQAVSCQTRFYALMLCAATGRAWSAGNEIIGKKKMIDVSVTTDDADEMIRMARDLSEIARTETPPAAERKGICASCSYRHLCGYA